MRRNHFITSQKVSTFLFVLLVMAIYNQWQNPTAWIYLALHGTYGFLWALKSRFFPDKQWEQPAGWSYFFLAWGSLSLYWVAPWLLAWRGVQAPPWYLALCIGLFAFGAFFHFASDMQKYISLKLRPGELITDGLWSLSRNPNYFGEFLIYLSFGLLAMHWLPLVILAVWFFGFWLPNMRRKDRSLSRYPSFEAYRQRTKFFIPFIY